MVNITSFQEVSATCFNWCKEQNIINASNLEIKGIFIPLIALISFFIGYLIYNHHEWIIKHINYEDFKLTEERLTKAFTLLYEFGIYLMLGFFIWYLYFR